MDFLPLLPQRPSCRLWRGPGLCGFRLYAEAARLELAVGVELEDDDARAGRAELAEAARLARLEAKLAG